MPPEYCPSQVFLCTEFYGQPVCFNDEMENARFEAMEDVLKQELFLPFELSLVELLRHLKLLRADGEEKGRWITTKNGKHIQIGENGELLKGNPAAIGGGDKIKKKVQSLNKKKAEAEARKKEEQSKENIENSHKSGTIKEHKKEKLSKSREGRKIAQKCPVDIPKNATVQDDDKPTYRQKIFRWIEKDKNGKELITQARWHERTPNAPKDNGDTWVITRKNQSAKTEEYLTLNNGKEEWVSRSVWKDAINARKQNESEEKQSVLQKGHLKNRGK